MTTVYFIRHSIGIEKIIKVINRSEHLQLQNEKTVLSIEGEERANTLSGVKELSNIDVVISSDYARTMATAKYIANKNDLDILIEENFRERKQGVSSYSELPENYGVKQFEDENFKVGDGENQKEVRERMNKALLNVLEQYKNKNVAIVSHGTAMMFLFKKWCEVTTNGFSFKVNFKGKEVWNNQFDAPEVFKLIFDDKELISIENIRPTELIWKNTPLI